MPGPPTGTISTYSRHLEALNDEPITSIYTCDEAYAEDMLQPGEQNFLGEFPSDDYYAHTTHPPTGYVATARPACTAAYSGNATLANDGADTGTIAPISATAVVTVTAKDLSGRQFALTVYDPWGADDTLEFTSTIEGDYTVTIEDFPSKPGVFVIPVRA